MNVLEVMKGAAAALRNGEYPGTSQELMEARAAVAELIEAAGEVAKFRLTSHGGPRLRAALARVKGVQS